MCVHTMVHTYLQARQLCPSHPPWQPSAARMYMLDHAQPPRPVPASRSFHLGHLSARGEGGREGGGSFPINRCVRLRSPEEQAGLVDLVCHFQNFSGLSRTLSPSFETHQQEPCADVSALRVIQTYQVQGGRDTVETHPQEYNLSLGRACFL